MLEQRIRWANFEHSRTLEDFDFHVNPQLPKSKLIDLATAGFVMQRRNVLLLGPSGGFQAAFIVAAALSILGLVQTRIMVPAQVKQPSAQAEQPGQPTGSGETPGLAGQ
jgi:DNA replication protein DnaC